MIVSHTISNWLILYGPTLKSEANVNSQACLTVAQMIVFNTKKRGSVDQTKNRHTLDREPPLPVYLGLNIHSLVRSKILIDELHELHVCISYDRVLQLENEIGHSMCQQFLAENIVCPSHLRKGIFVASALENLDHNLSSTTAQSAFHGTAIGLMQFPTESNTGHCREPLMLGKGDTIKELMLPQSYTTVPVVALNASLTSVPKRNCQTFSGSLDRALVRDKFPSIVPFLQRQNTFSGHGQQSTAKISLW